MAEEKTVTGLPTNTEAALTYSLGWVTGLIFILIEKKDKVVRFHALQSIITFGAINVATFVPFIGWMLSPLLGILAFVLWLILIIKTYQGEKMKLPVVGDIAEKQVDNIK